MRERGKHGGIMAQQKEEQKNDIAVKRIRKLEESLVA